MSGFPRGSSGGGGGSISTITSTGGTITVTDPTGPSTDLETALTAAQIEALFTAANQVFNGTGAGTGTVTANPEVSSLGVGTPASGTAGRLDLLPTGANISPNAGAMAINNGGSIGVQIWGVVTMGINGSNTNVSAILNTNGLNTANHAAFSTPAIVSGSAFTPNATFDTIVQIDLAATTLGTLTVTYGPTTGAENTWLPAANVVAGSDIVSTLPVPAGWKVVATATGVTVALSASVHRY